MYRKHKGIIIYSNYSLASQGNSALKFPSQNPPLRITNLALVPKKHKYYSIYKLKWIDNLIYIHISPHVRELNFSHTCISCHNNLCKCIQIASKMEPFESIFFSLDLSRIRTWSRPLQVCVGTSLKRHILEFCARSRNQSKSKHNYAQQHNRRFKVTCVQNANMAGRKTNNI